VKFRRLSPCHALAVFLLLFLLAIPAICIAALPVTAAPVGASPVVKNVDSASAASSGASTRQAPPAGEKIPWSELGAHAGKKYSGEALSVSASESGARLRTDFQRLRGEVTQKGLALESTATDKGGERFVLRADALRRNGKDPLKLADTGKVETDKNLARWIRPAVTEEYSVSVDGVRQDFVITERLAGEGPLKLELALSGARAETTAYGARITLASSGRKLAYSRLKAWDAAGRGLSARMSATAPDRLTVEVEDRDAKMPLRIDPTISDDNWVSMGGINGVDGGFVSALVFDGSGNLYVAGGLFAVAGNVEAYNIAKWNGSAWSALGSGLNGWVFALAIDGSGNLYAGGRFGVYAGGVSIHSIAKWDGNTWSALGSGLAMVGSWDSSPMVHALAVDKSNNLYVGGYFNNAGGVNVHSLAKWDGSAWSALGSGYGFGDDPGFVHALAIDGSGNLYAGGDLRSMGGVNAEDIAKWDGSVWSGLGSGIGGDAYCVVMALAIDSSGNLYAGGHFDTAGGVRVNNIAKWSGLKWNGGGWSALGSGVSGNGTGSMNQTRVRALAFDGSGNLYAGGYFTTAGGVSANNIAKWDGSSWSALGSGTRTYDAANVENPGVKTLAIDGSGNIFAGGTFEYAGDMGVRNIAKWDGSGWSALGSGSNAGINNTVTAVAIDGSGSLYVGGKFTSAGGVSVHSIAKWDGSAWSALGSGIDGDTYCSVQALAIDASGNLYAGGKFDTAGGVSATNIARWNGSSWSALGSGIGSSAYYPVRALAVDGSGNLYVGGMFDTAGGVSASNIVKWDGSAWSALGSGISGDAYSSVDALVVDFSGNIFAGGGFTSAGGTSASNIAKWDGSAWSALGSGVDGRVSAVAIDKSGNLYAGGYFHTAGGISASSVAKWDGNAWSALGSGIQTGNDPGDVNALAIDGSGNLFAGGEFNNAGGVGAHSIARWDGGSWSTLGSGVSWNVSALAIDNSRNLYAGGGFSIAGGKVSPYLAKLVLPPPATHFSVSAPATAITGTSFTFTVTALDQHNTPTDYNGMIHFTSSDGSAVLPADGRLSDGTGTFTATFNTIGNRTITATGATNATITGTSNTVAVSAAQATHFSASAPATATAGSAFNVTVTALDDNNNIATYYPGTVHFTCSDGAAVLPVDTKLVNGVGTFTVTLKTAGIHAITAWDTTTSTINGTTDNIAVNAGNGARFSLSAPASALPGSAFNVTVTALDACNNIATGYAGTVHFISTDSVAVLPANSKLTNGVGTFTATLNTSGSRTITATDTTASGVTGTSNTIAVGSGAATRLTVSAQPSAKSGSPFSVTVTALDTYNNTATDYSGTVHFTSSDGAAALPADSKLTSGVGTFSVTLNRTGNQTITATDTVTATIAGTSNSIAVSPAYLQLALPGGVTARSPFNVTVTAMDADYHTATGYAGTLHFTSSDATAVLPADEQLTNGAGTFSVTLYSAGTQTFTVADTKLSTLKTSTTILVSPAKDPDLTVTTGHKGDFKQGQTGATYTIRVTNRGIGPTTGAVKVTDSLPKEFTAASMAGSGWNCDPATVTCTRSTVLKPGKTYPPITIKVNVDPEAQASVTNSVTVSGGGEFNTDNDTATDVTTIIPVAPDLIITKKHSGKFRSGRIGAYTIKVTNSGNGPTRAAVTVTDNLPAGLIATSMTGSGWTCDLPSLTCTRSNVLKARASYPAIRLKVNITAATGASVINTAKVAGGGERDATNNEASDTVTVY